MLLTISTTHQPATDLGFLLHKHPDKFQSIDLSIGKAHIFYPESDENKTTIALLLDIDPIDMVKGARNLSGRNFSLGHYINDRPYVASSFMSVALGKAFSTALNGKCSGKPEMVSVPIPLEAKISALPAAKGGEKLIRKLFEPLGYEVSLTRHVLDPKFPQWGDSKYFSITLSHTLRIQELLNHLYVLIPVLDNDKHYFVSESEIKKLLTRGEGWLPSHPEKKQIIKRYLVGLKSLSRKALEELKNIDAAELPNEKAEEKNEKAATLHKERLQVVLAKLKESGAEKVIDLGCGEGKLLQMLMREKQFAKIAGMDVSYNELVKAKERLKFENMAPKQQERINIFQGALTYRDSRLAGYDAAAVVEVIEHLDEERLAAFERVVFEFAQPGMVILTTPNREYNAVYSSLKEGEMRHNDHRFEWTRQEFENWAQEVAAKYNYQVDFLPVGPVKDDIGAPSQMGIFTYGN